MITITAKITVLSGDEFALSLPEDFNRGNNISSDISSVLRKKDVQTKNPFIIGSNKLGDGTTFSEKLNYFMGNEFSNEQGIFPNAYELVISSYSPINSITLAFDTTNARHPQSIELVSADGSSTTYIDDDAIFTLINPPKYSNNSIKVIIRNWNKPNSQFLLSGIYTSIDIIVDKRNLISFNGKITDRSDIKTPSYGIISNTGNLEFKDINGEIRDYAEQMLLTSELKAYIKLKNTLSNTVVDVAAYETREWNYDNDNRKVSVSLKDNLEEWQDIYVDGFDYDPRNPNRVIDGTALGLYKWIYYKTPYKYRMASESDLDQKTRQLMRATLIPYPLLESGNLWQQWNKLCQLCGLYIYRKPNGTTTCSYTYGS